MKRRQYGSGSVFQRKDGMWVGRIEGGTDRNGKRRPIPVYATSEARCKEKLEEKKREIARNGVTGAGSRTTVEQWAKAWLAVAVTELRPGSYRSTESCVNAWIVPTIGRRRLEHLSPADVRAIHAAQREAKDAEGKSKPLKPSTMIRTHAVVMKMLRDAVREGHHVPQAALLVKKPQAGESDRQAIPLADALAILNVAGSRPDASLWAALLLQGLRQGERLGLTWECVDFESETLDISWQLQSLPYIDRRDKSLGFRVPDGYVSRHLAGGHHLVRPKTAKGRRVIPMTPWLVDALIVWRAITPASEMDLVWPADNGQPRRTVDDREDWKAIQALADVEHPTGRRYLLHEARHTTATLLLELGVDKSTVEAILGHSKFVESYDHSDTLPKQRAALAKVAERLALT